VSRSPSRVRDGGHGVTLVSSPAGWPFARVAMSRRPAGRVPRAGTATGTPRPPLSFVPLMEVAASWSAPRVQRFSRGPRASPRRPALRKSIGGNASAPVAITLARGSTASGTCHAHRPATCPAIPASRPPTQNPSGAIDRLGVAVQDHAASAAGTRARSLQSTRAGHAAAADGAAARSRGER